MTPNENLDQQHMGTVRAASMINMLAGIWLFVSPWGALIAILAAIRVSDPRGETWMSWLNCLFGIWVFASPWIYAGAAGAASSRAALPALFSPGLIRL